MSRPIKTSNDEPPSIEVNRDKAKRDRVTEATQSDRGDAKAGDRNAGRARKFRRTYWHLWKWFALIAVILIVRVVQTATTPDYRADKRPTLRNGKCEIVEILAGNEFLIRLSPRTNTEPAGTTPTTSERIIHVKLMSVEVPAEDSEESQHAIRAKQFSTELLASGQPWIELDRRRILRDGRGLVFLYVGEQCLNLELPRAGLARVKIYPGDSRWMEKRLQEAQQEAQENQRGIWAE